MVDVEADGPIPGDYSMVSFGAVLCSDPSKTFYATLKPISDKWNPDALAVSKFTRDQTLSFDDPLVVMQRFNEWVVNSTPRPMFISDNNGFDWQFINWYFHHYINTNPFGHSSTNLGSLYKGFKHDMFSNFKKLRKTKHIHNAIDDAMGNVEALIAIKRMGLNIHL